LASADIVHALASSGCSSVLPGLKRSRPWKMGRVALAVLLLSQRPGSKPSGLASAQ
jgi:hypothetical protein